jgi:hypothetical protein
MNQDTTETETKPKTYEFYTEDMDGNETVWAGLTKTKVVQMYRYTEQSQPSNVKSFGWKKTR